MRSSLSIGLLALVLAGLSSCGDDDDGDITAFCDKVEELNEGAASIEEPGPEGDQMAAARADLEQAQDRLAELGDVAPEEIQADLEEVSTFFDDFVAAVSETDSATDFLATATEFQQKGGDVEEPARRLNDYAESECDLDLGVAPPSGG